MLIFILLLIFIILLYPICGKKNIIVNNELKKENNIIYIYIISFVLSCILGLRSNKVGIDTLYYYKSFYSIKNISFSQIFNIDIERGFLVFQYIIGKLFGNFQFLLIIVALMFISVVSYLIYKYSENPMISYILFITFDFYTFAMSATRQTIAITLVMVSLIYVMKQKKILFFIFVLLASSFHITALIFLPCYWFNKIKFNKKSILIFIIIIFSVNLFKNQIILILNNYARISYDVTETVGNNLYIIMILTALLGILYRKKIINKDESNKYFFFMIISSVIIMPIARINPIMIRLYYYFFIFMIIYIPNILKVINNKTLKNFLLSIYITLGLYWFFTSIIYVEQLETYSFFWQ